MKLKVTVNGTAYDIDVEVQEETRKTLGSIVVGGASASAAGAAPAPAAVSGDGIPAPLAGSVLKILVEDGQEVKAGDVVVVLEAMKMETEITAPADGVVAGILVKPGDAVQAGQALIQLGAAASPAAPAQTATPATPAAVGGKGTPVPAPLAGSVLKILVAAGDQVVADQTVVVLEAMKMETEIKSPQAGTVASVLVNPGDAVQGGQALIEIS